VKESADTEHTRAAKEIEKCLDKNKGIVISYNSCRQKNKLQKTRNQTINLEATATGL
jgi:hypothetical protein